MKNSKITLRSINLLKPLRRVASLLRCRPICVAALILIVLIALSNLFFPRSIDNYYNYLNDLEIVDNRYSEFSGTIVYLQKKEYGGEDVLSAKVKNVRTDSGTRITSYYQYITVNLPKECDIRIGQRILYGGKASFYTHATNPGEFDYADYCSNIGNMFTVKNATILARSSSYNILSHTLFRIRLGAEAILQQNLTFEDAAIMKAMLLGNKNEISDDTKELFQKNGIAHILAISGLHISLIGMAMFKLLRKTHLSIPLSSGISMSIILLYGLMVGMSTSAVRAITMFSIFLLSKCIKRTYDIMTSVSVAFCLLLIYNRGLINDSGFQLSFLAVLGVGLMCSLFQKNVATAPKWASPMLISFFVFMTTLPVILSSYYEVALYSILLNLIIIPPMSILIGTTVILLLTGLVSNFVSYKLYFICRLPALIVSIILHVYKSLCRFCESNGLGRFNIGSPSGYQIIAYYILLIIGCLFPQKVTDKKGKRVMLSLCLFATAFFVISFHPHFGCNIYCVDVGQGDCMLIQNDNGNTYIIDGGSSSTKNVGEKRIVPLVKYLGINTIDGIFLTHPDSDHTNGIADLLDNCTKEHLHVKNIYIYEGFRNLDGSGFDDIYRLSDINNINIVTLASGNVISDNNLIFHVLYPYKGKTTANLNDASLCMNVEYRGFHMLTTGDMESSAELWITENIKNCDYDILKVAHHGSSSSTSDSFLSYARPDVAIISVGENNTYGHPHRDTLYRLKNHNTAVFRTDKLGCIRITVSSNGKYKVKNSRIK